MSKLKTVLFWASLWGIFEATVGYALHLSPVRLGWFFWASIAFYFMNKVYKKTKDHNTIIYTALIAASIKLLNLFMPVRIDMVINPAMSIMLEGLTLFAICKVHEKYPVNEFLFAASLNTLWRVLYLHYILTMPDWMVQISPLRALQPFLRFLVFENLITSAVIFISLYHGKDIWSFLHSRLSKFMEVKISLSKGAQIVGIAFLLILNIVLTVFL